MKIEYPFLTVGQVSDLLDVPAVTIRDWGNRLEDLGVHYLKRNDRGERIYEETDIAIIRFIQEYKKKYGRFTTMEDLGRMILDDESLITRNEIISPPPNEKESDKTVSKEVFSSQEGLTVLLQNAVYASAAELSKRAEAAIEQATERISQQMQENLDKQREEMKKELENHKKLLDEKFESITKERADKLDQVINTQLEILKEQKKQNEQNSKKKGFWSFLRG
ncbi:hypothetical protein AM501_23955 [Aneurinibacillus migulanus]|uniref:MerR family transcriptional regulator n=1 Tax=Aneurinibacillus migulanus TaxID=47500 RepID=UPI0005BC3BB8|nr:MerR family transcriptional regulator [Aneurinibacillus migulanus]KIV58937.1 hypothetical protein TS64_04025 [Aneurinibacillus migulanus]KPD05831.1 hypothetical protein AM501_23955 [Aneurinibacillus migulanus]